VKASTLSFRIAVLLGLIGMAWGIVMGISRDHSTMPAHAHLNLLGWVSLFLFGIYYRLHPATDGGRLALAQVLLWGFGTVVMIVGVTGVHSGREALEPFAAVGSLVVVTSMLLFAMLVFRPAAADRATSRAFLSPAE
jgi:hypothetical protein